MTIKVKITFYEMSSDSPRAVGIITNVVQDLEVPFSALTLGDLTDRIAECEAYLSRITGLQVRIETASE